LATDRSRPAHGRARPTVLALPGAREAIVIGLLGSPALAAGQSLPMQSPLDAIVPGSMPRLGAPLTLPEERRNTGPGESATVFVERVVVRGNEALTAAALAPFTAGLEHRTATLATIEEARFGTLRAYREAGYAYVAVAAGLTPLPGGAAELTIEVTEGFVSEVKLDGEIGPAATQVLRFLDPLVGQRPITTAALERALLLASDIPGVVVRGLLRPLPGTPGALQLLVQLQRNAVSGFLNVDNRGYSATGAWQGLLVAGANSFTSFGERTEIAGLHGESNNQNFIQGSEEFFIGGSGLRMRIYGGAGRATPGSTLAAIGYRGDTWLAGAALAYPVIRSRPLNLSVTGQFDAFESTVNTNLTANGTSQPMTRDSVRAIRIGAEGSLRDALLGRWLAPGTVAINFATIRVSQGVQWLGASEAGSPTVSRVSSDFGFTKLNGELTRQQPLFRPWDGVMVAIQGTLAGQYSGNILPPSEKFYLGGARIGRGFYAGQVSGDSGYGYSIEVQLNTGVEVPLPRRWSGNPWLGAGPLGPWLGTTGVDLATQFYVFHDQGNVYENKAGDPAGRVSSWGGGVRTIVNERLEFDVEGVHRVTRNPNGVTTPLLAANAIYARMLVRF
jgi:hemolysin activation/secretion protein